MSKVRSLAEYKKLKLHNQISNDNHFGDKNKSDISGDIGDSKDDKAREKKSLFSKLSDNQGKIGWALLWLMGVPLPILLVLYIFMG
ncbi:MAG: hypothetical protein M9962_12105 [Oligoflexia bacterium]|nr:hypothetical protein [Oligoflexia bacterium]